VTTENHQIMKNPSCCTELSPSQSRRLKSGGFTLLELLVVIVIIGMLAAFVGPKYFAQIGKSELTIAQSQIESLSKALDSYRLDIGHYPSTEQGLAVLYSRPTDSKEKWHGPYLSKKVPLDPWGHAYVYTSPGSTADYELWSMGKDGKAGGSGENADIGR